MPPSWPLFVARRAGPARTDRRVASRWSAVAARGSRLHGGRSAATRRARPPRVVTERKDGALTPRERDGTALGRPAEAASHGGTSQRACGAEGGKQPPRWPHPRRDAGKGGMPQWGWPRDRQTPRTHGHEGPRIAVPRHAANSTCTCIVPRGVAPSPSRVAKSGQCPHPPCHDRRDSVQYSLCPVTCAPCMTGGHESGRIAIVPAWDSTGRRPDRPCHTARNVMN